MQRQTLLDGVAAGISLACLVHCLGLPLLIAALPALSDALDLPETVHRFVLLVALPASALALHAGLRRHGAPGPALAGLAGLGLMGLGAFAAAASIALVLSVAGSLVVAAAHLRNWRRVRACAGRG